MLLQQITTQINSIALLIAICSVLIAAMILVSVAMILSRLNDAITVLLAIEKKVK